MKNLFSFFSWKNFFFSFISIFVFFRVAIKNHFGVREFGFFSLLRGKRENEDLRKVKSSLSFSLASLDRVYLYTRQSSQQAENVHPHLKLYLQSFPQTFLSRNSNKFSFFSLLSPPSSSLSMAIFAVIQGRCPV